MSLRYVLALIAAVSLISHAAGDEGPGQPPQQSTPDERRLQIIKEVAKAYSLYDARDVEHPLTRANPLLKFEDPVTQATMGAVYVWSNDQKRPLAIASIYFRGDGARVDEFQSLTEANLVAEFRDEVVWRPALPGVEWKILPGGVPDTRPLRLAKMRELARQFAASVRDAKSGRQELRLLPQPIYRYEDANRRIVDGALFCYAKGTNPEVLLLLQAETSAGGTQWQHAFCRMTERECEVKSDEHVVWKAAKTQIPQAPEDPYFNRTTR